MRVNSRQVTVPIWLGLVLVLAGCVPPTPSAEDWRADAAQTLEDVTSEVATAQFVIVQRSRGRLMSRTAAVMLLDSEDAAARATQTLTSVQPPPSVRRVEAQVSEAVTQATTVLRTVRIAVVEGNVGSYAALGRELSGARDDLLALTDEMRAQ